MIDFRTWTISLAVSCHMHAQTYIFVLTPSSILARSPSEIMDPVVETESSITGSLLSLFIFGMSSRSLRRLLSIRACSRSVPQYWGSTNNLNEKKILMLIVEGFCVWLVREL